MVGNSLLGLLEAEKLAGSWEDGKDGGEEGESREYLQRNSFYS